MADDYIRKADVLNLPQSVERNLRGEIVERSVDVGAIEALPSADVVQVVHSYWEGEETDCNIKCHKCEKAFKDYIITQDYADLNEYPNFCPNCGAKMEENNG